MGRRFISPLPPGAVNHDRFENKRVHVACIKTTSQGPVTDLVDGCSQVIGVDWQHQPYSTLSDKPDVCVRCRQNQVVPGERWLGVI
jgi:hypothetical protein